MANPRVQEVQLQAQQMIEAFIKGQPVPGHVYERVYEILVRRLLDGIHRAPVGPLSHELQTILREHIRDRIPERYRPIGTGAPAGAFSYAEVINKMPNFKNFKLEVKPIPDNLKDDMGELREIWEKGFNIDTWLRKGPLGARRASSGLITVRDVANNVNIYEGYSDDLADAATQTYLETQAHAKQVQDEEDKTYYQKYFGFDPEADLIYWTKYKKGEYTRLGYEQIFTPTNDPTLAAQGLEVIARVYQEGKKIFNRMVFRRNLGKAVFVHRQTSGDSRDDYLAYKATQYLDQSSLRDEQILHVLCAQIPEITAAEAVSALKRAKLHPRSSYHAGTTRLVGSSGVTEREVTCIHTAIYSTTLADVDKMKDKDLARTSIREYSGVQAIKDLSLQDHFASLKSYVQGIVEMGIQNTFTASYHSEEFNPETLPFGFNSAMQSQVLEAIREVMPKGTMTQWALDVAAEIIDSVPRAWLASRWKTLWFRNYKGIPALILEKYPSFMPLLKDVLRKRLQNVRVDTLKPAQVKDYLVFLKDF